MNATTLDLVTALREVSKPDFDARRDRLGAWATIDTEFRRLGASLKAEAISMGVDLEDAVQTAQLNLFRTRQMVLGRLANATPKEGEAWPSDKVLEDVASAGLRQVPLDDVLACVHDSEPHEALLTSCYLDGVPGCPTSHGHNGATPGRLRSYYRTAIQKELSRAWRAKGGGSEQLTDRMSGPGSLEIAARDHADREREEAMTCSSSSSPDSELEARWNERAQLEILASLGSTTLEDAVETWLIGPFLREAAKTRPRARGQWRALSALSERVRRGDPLNRTDRRARESAIELLMAPLVEAPSSLLLELVRRGFRWTEAARIVLAIAGGAELVPVLASWRERVMDRDAEQAWRLLATYLLHTRFRARSVQEDEDPVDTVHAVVAGVLETRND